MGWSTSRIFFYEAFTISFAVTRKEKEEEEEEAMISRYTRFQGAASKLVNIAEERDARERGCVCEARGKGDPLEVPLFGYFGYFFLFCGYSIPISKK